MNALVSIIIPVYNVEKYLGRCIESIIKQRYKNIEIILIDDGSTDSSGKIADDFALNDNRITVIHQKNSGVSTARNKGMDKASGDYICFADADDYLMDDYIEYLLKMSLKNNADISITTKMFGNFNLKQTISDKFHVLSPEQATEAILCYRIPIGVYCKLFKRSFLKDNISFVPSIYIGEGFNFNTAAFQRANFINVGQRKIYYYRRNNPSSATTHFSADKWINGIKAIETINKDFIIKSKKLKNAWKFANWRTHSDAYDLIVLSSSESDYPKLYRKCLQIVRKRAYYAFLVPSSFNNRLRALIMMFFPRLIPKIMILRRKIFHANLNN